MIDLTELAVQKLEQDTVVPGAVDAALVVPQHADAPEADAFIAANCPLVRGLRVDRETVVATLVEEVTRQRADGVGAEPLPVPGAPEEDVDARVTVVRVGFLGT